MSQGLMNQAQNKGATFIEWAKTQFKAGGAFSRFTPGGSFNEDDLFCPVHKNEPFEMVYPVKKSERKIQGKWTKRIYISYGKFCEQCNKTYTNLAMDRVNAEAEGRVWQA